MASTVNTRRTWGCDRSSGRWCSGVPTQKSFDSIQPFTLLTPWDRPTGLQVGQRERHAFPPRRLHRNGAWVHRWLQALISAETRLEQQDGSHIDGEWRTHTPRLKRKNRASRANAFYKNLRRENTFFFLNLYRCTYTRYTNQTAFSNDFVMLRRGPARLPFPPSALYLSSLASAGLRLVCAPSCGHLWCCYSVDLFSSLEHRFLPAASSPTWPELSWSCPGSPLVLTPASRSSFHGYN